MWRGRPRPRACRGLAENLEPVIKPQLGIGSNRGRLLAQSLRNDLPVDRIGVMQRQIEMQIEIMKSWSALYGRM